MRAGGAALRCRGLVKRYGSVVAVDGLDLEVRRGECFGLLGPNGAGKTTTVEICEGLNEPDAGEVEVLGERWHGDGLALRARLGIQLQETKFPEKLRVREVVALFRSFYPRGRSVAETLALVQLQEKADALREGPLRRPEAAAVAGVRAGRRPGAAVPRRAHHRARPAVAAVRPGTSSRRSRRAGARCC